MYQTNATRPLPRSDNAAAVPAAMLAVAQSIPVGCHETKSPVWKSPLGELRDEKGRCYCIRRGATRSSQITFRRTCYNIVTASSTLTGLYPRKGARQKRCYLYGLLNSINSDQALSNAIFTRDSIYAIARIRHGSSICLSVCLSVRPSHGWISQNRLKLGSRNFHHTVAPSL